MNWYGDLLAHLLRGKRAAPRGMPVLEQYDVQLKITQPLFYSHVRDLNYRFMLAEAMWMAQGRDDVEYLARYNPNISRYSDDSIRLHGAYGPRFFKQWPQIRDNLLRTESRQAVAVIFDPGDLRVRTKDVPCTISWQFQLRDSGLHMTANMRSSDAWLGVPYDVFTFWHMGNCVAGELRVKLQSLTMNLANSHVYAEHWQLAESLDTPTYHSLPSVRGFGHEWQIPATKRLAYEQIRTQAANVLQVR